MSVQRQFYRDIYKWVTQDNCGPNVHGFTKFCGLCSNYLHWTQAHKKKRHSLEDDFYEAGFKNTDYPFNTNETQFNNEVANGTFYSNPKRLKWVKDHC